MMQKFVQTQTFTVSFLSPVHIGTEERLDNHDFVYENGRLVRFKITPILEQMNDLQLARFVDEGLQAVRDWLRQQGLWQQAKLYESPVPRPPNWLREPIRPFIADPLFRPYLPGTELKGAIRTAIAWWLLKQLSQSRLAAFENQLRQRLPHQPPSRRELTQAGQWLEQNLLGEDPNHDLLRSLRVQDSNPVAPNRLKVVPVLVAVKTNTGLRWLQTPRRQNQPSQYTDDHTRAVANFCECLDERVSGVFVTTACDEFLASGEIGKGETKLSVPKELHWEDAKREAIANWQEACNELAKEVAEKERNWWQQAKQTSRNLNEQIIAGAMERFYSNLLRQIQAESEQAVFINLGWGSGWRTKTVTEIFGDEVVREVVSRYRLDRGANSRPFPKTRKLAWLGGNEFAPLGWLKLTPKG